MVGLTWDFDGEPADDPAALRPAGADHDRQASTRRNASEVRDDALLDSLSRRDRDPRFGSPSLVAQTTTIAAYPTSAQRFFACVPQTVLGAEVEGGPALVPPGTSTFFALNLGTAVPPTGTDVLATFVESRWVFRYDG